MLTRGCQHDLSIPAVCSQVYESVSLLWRLTDSNICRMLQHFTTQCFTSPMRHRRQVSPRRGHPAAGRQSAQKQAQNQGRSCWLAPADTAVLPTGLNTRRNCLRLPPGAVCCSAIIQFSTTIVSAASAATAISAAGGCMCLPASCCSPLKPPLLGSTSPAVACC